MGRRCQLSINDWSYSIFVPNHALFFCSWYLVVEQGVQSDGSLIFRLEADGLILLRHVVARIAPVGIGIGGL